MFFKRKNPPQDVEKSKENKGYLTEKEKQDFFCYLIATLDTVSEKLNKIFGLLITLAVIGVIELFQILLLLLR